MDYNIEAVKQHILDAAFDDSMTPLDCERLLEQFCNQMPLLYLTTDYKILARCSYNRYDEEVSEIFNNVGRLSYNPNIDSIKLQRCNYPKQQMFYGAVGLDHEKASMMSTAIMEVCFEYIKQANLNTHYMTISRWQITRPLDVFVLPFASQSLINNPEFKKASEHFATGLPLLAEKHNMPLEYLKSFLEFMGDLFCMRENKSNYYKITSAYINYMLNFATAINKRIDGILYPSANTEAAGMNIVLRTNVIDNKIIYADKAVMYKAKRYTNNSKHFDFVDASNEADIDDNGKFHFTHIW